MKKSVKRLLALGLAGTMVVSMAACGSGEEEKDKAASDSAGGEEEAVEITFTWWGGQSRHDYTQELMDKYTELHPNVTFKGIPAGWDGYFDKLSTQAASGSMPDIVQMDYLYITTYAKNNSVADLQPYIDDGTIDVSGIDESLLNTGKIDGKTAGLVGATSILAVGYNPDVFAEAGLEEPTGEWTWDDFAEMARTITEKTGKLGTAAGPVDDTNIFNYWVRQHGETLFGEDNKSLGYEDDQILVDYLEYWKGLMDDKAAANPDEYAQIQTLGQEAGPVVTGEGGMTGGWNNYANQVSGINDRVKIVSPPLDENNTEALWNKPGYFLCISETSKVKDEAAEFINWFLNSDEANEIMMGERGVPAASGAREYLNTSGKMNESQKSMFDYVDQVAQYCGETPAPDPIGMSEVNEVFKNCAYSAFYGQATAEEAAADFRTQANEILARNN